MLNDTCPHCGYCKHCGRGGSFTRPWYPYTQPYWYNTTGGNYLDSSKFEFTLQANAGDNTTHAVSNASCKH